MSALDELQTLSGYFTGLGDLEFSKRVDEIRADVAELLAAGTELIDAQAHYDAIDFPGGRRWDRLAIARDRHAAALARCNEASQ